MEVDELTNMSSDQEKTRKKLMISVQLGLFRIALFLKKWGVNHACREFINEMYQQYVNLFLCFDCSYPLSYFEQKE